MRSNFRPALQLTATLLVVATSVACGRTQFGSAELKKESANCKAGTETCTCREDGSCEAGLTCISNLCVDAGAPPKNSRPPSPPDDPSRGSEDPQEPTEAPPDTDPTPDDAEDGSDTVPPEHETGSEGDPEPSENTLKLDMLFVIDNTNSMADEQLFLAKALPSLVERFEKGVQKGDEHLPIDAQFMFTTTDFGNPQCEQQNPSYSPEQGRPVTESCTRRLSRFLSPDPQKPSRREDACNDVCEAEFRLRDDDHFIRFNSNENNLDRGIRPKDINSDGVTDSELAAGLACMLPQGLDGCGYESPLESMMQAINPNQKWNQGEHPFMRDDATLAIVILSDEIDCSISDFSLMNDRSLYNRLEGELQPSSGICWNASVECKEDPDRSGYYQSCEDTQHAKMHRIDRYREYLRDYLILDRQKEVVMLAIVGVPPDGEKTIYRDWQDPQFPEGDIPPGDWPRRNAEYKQWAYSIGPVCSGVVPAGQKNAGQVFSQAIPSIRTKALCESLNEDDRTRCCLHSICEADQSSALECLFDRFAESP